MTLDDYPAAVPLWLAICAVLDAHGQASVYAVAARATRLTGRYARSAATSAMLRRMVEDGIVEIVPSPATGRRMPAKVHRLTGDGRDLYTEALTIVCGVLSLERQHGNKKKRG